MAKNYADQTDMEQAGYKGDDTLYKRNENEGNEEDERRSTMSGENVIPEKYGNREEDLPPQIGDENPAFFRQRQQKNYENGNALNEDKKLQQQDGQRYQDTTKNANQSFGQNDGKFNTELQDERAYQENEQRGTPF